MTPSTKETVLRELRMARSQCLRELRMARSQCSFLGAVDGKQDTARLFQLDFAIAEVEAIVCEEDSK